MKKTNLLISIFLVVVTTGCGNLDKYFEEAPPKDQEEEREVKPSNDKAMNSYHLLPEKPERELKPGKAMASETQNGGYGLSLNNSIVSLDLFMRGVHLAPYLSKDFAGNGLAPWETEILLKHISKVSHGGVRQIVINKLAELRTRVRQERVIFPVHNLVYNLENFTWIQLDGLSCKNVHDDNAPYPGKVQLAYRERRYIRFCQDFKTLDTASQAALILHEIIYAALEELSVTRELVGFLFSSAFKKFDKSAKQEFIELIHEIGHSLRDEYKYAYVEKLGSIAPHVLESVPLSPGKEACFGSGYEAAGNGFLVWQVDQKKGCKIGEIPAYWRFMDQFKRENGDLYSFKVSEKNDQKEIIYVEAVDIDPANMILKEFCTGPYIQLCHVEIGKSYSKTKIDHLDSTLDYAITNNLAQRMEYFINLPGDFNAKDHLPTAIQSGHLEMVSLLLDKVSLEGFNLNHPLHVAAQVQNKDIFDLILEDPRLEIEQKKDYSGVPKTVLDYLVEKCRRGSDQCQYELVESLILKKAQEQQLSLPLIKIKQWIITL